MTHLDKLVKKAIFSIAPLLCRLLGPRYIVSVTSFDLCLLGHSLVRAVRELIDLRGNLLARLFGHMALLEHIDRGLMRGHVSQQVQVVLSPKLLGLLQQHSRLNLGFFLTRLLHLPPELGGLSAGEFRQLASMDANGDIAELGSVVEDHFIPATLVQLLPSQL